MKTLRVKWKLCIYLLVFVQYIHCQKLPYEFHFSADGHRLIRGKTEVAGFYYMESIDTIYLEFPQSNYWALLTGNYSSKTDLPATLKYKGEKYDSVGVRFKGMTSYQRLRNSNKKSFNISMDFVKDQDINGYNTFNLNNGFEDPSRLREFLYFYFNRKHIPSAKANFVILMINGSSWGIYTNVQQLNKQHAREWFEDADATRWRAEGANSDFGGDPGGGGPGGGGPGFGAGKSTLNYLGNDTAVYQENYTLKNAYTENPWENLVTACRVLNTVDKTKLVDTLNKVMDVDGALWFLAHEILFTDDDGYVNKGGMDYYVYYDVGTNRLVPVEYDGNTTFITRDATSWGPCYKQENTNFPLMNILFSVPELRQRYLAHVRTILKESLNMEVAYALIDKYSDFIDSYINDDPKKIYTFSEFKSDITVLKDFISSRNTFLTSNAEIDKETPSISDVIFKAGVENFTLPGKDDVVHVTAYVTHSQGLSGVYLYYSTGLQGTFTKIAMLDDGDHNDGSNGDNMYGAQIPAFEKGTYVRFYIEAVDATITGARSYSPEGAEHDVFFYRVKVADKVYSDVVINEIMPSNSIIPDQDGETDDWIELYNNSSYPMNLSGYYLTDNSSKLTKWKFPEGTVIEGNGYLIVWADNDTLQDGLHANFKLASDGEEILLVSPEIDISDEVVFNAQNIQLAYARMENGIGPFTWQVPTCNSENKIISTTITGISVQKELIIYPNPTRDFVNIEMDDPEENGTLFVYDILGKMMMNKPFNGNATIDVSEFNKGIYIISVNNIVYKRLVIDH